MTTITLNCTTLCAFAFTLADAANRYIIADDFDELEQKTAIRAHMESYCMAIDTIMDRAFGISYGVWNNLILADFRGWLSALDPEDIHDTTIITKVCEIIFSDEY